MSCLSGGDSGVTFAPLEHLMPRNMPNRALDSREDAVLGIRFLCDEQSGGGGKALLGMGQICIF